MPLVLNGSGISDSNISSLSASKLIGQLPDANANSGAVLQVIQSVKPDTFAGGVGGVWFQLHQLAQLVKF